PAPAVHHGHRQRRAAAGNASAPGRRAGHAAARGSVPRYGQRTRRRGACARGAHHRTRRALTGRACGHRLRGAILPRQASSARRSPALDKKITHYDKPAGGWDALKSTLHHLHEQGILGKGAHTLRRTNQPDGFDCPGCAWPDRNPHATFEFCENGAKAVAAEATAQRVTREFFAAHTVGELATKEDHYLEAQGRLTEPMRYDAASDRYVPIEWDAAFALIARELNALASPDEALFYTSGRTSNEAAFLYQLFVRVFGTNNLPDCSNMCHEASGVAMGEQIGIGKGT